MDLAYSAEYDAYRQEVRDFLESNKDSWPKRTGLGRPSEELKRWQAMLIERGLYSANNSKGIRRLWR